MTESVPIEEVRPTTLYLDAGELAAVIAAFDFDNPDYLPPRTFHLDADVYLAEGHARTFVAYLAGVAELCVDADAKLGTDELRLCRERIGWCEDAGVETIDHLAGRIVSTETYVDVCVEQCLRTAQRITAGRV